MRRAEEIENKYHQKRDDLRQKLQPLFDEKDEKRAAIRKVFDKPKEQTESRKLEQAKRQELNQKFREDNKDLIAEYKKLAKEHKDNETVFEDIFTRATQVWLTELDKDAFRKAIMWKTETKESKSNTYEHLLNKENMTAKDKENMKKSINFLVDKKMDTSENIKKLEAINYRFDYIEIGWVKRTRENLKAEPNKKDIFKHGDEVYFKFDTLKEQNKLLAKQWMEIPWKENFVKTLKALPGEYSESNRYAWANIMWNILGLSMSGWCDSDGELSNKGEYGYVWSSSERNSNCAWSFRFNEDEGILNWGNSYNAFAVRPVFK